MRGDELARQWRVARPIEATSNGLNLPKNKQHEEAGSRRIYRDLEPLQAAGFSL